jgi:hypothetical protein
MSLAHALAYLATPYSRYPAGLHQAFIDASALAALLLTMGVKCYSPIAHTHPLALYGGLDPLDHALWLGFDAVMMDRCEVLIVAHLSGWQESRGIAHEVEVFAAAGKPIYDLEPQPLRLTRRRDPPPPSAPALLINPSQGAHAPCSDQVEGGRAGAVPSGGRRP